MSVQNDSTDKLREAQAAVTDSLRELEYLTSCRCDIAWTGRGLHETHCASEYREDVDKVARALGHSGAL